MLTTLDPGLLAIAGLTLKVTGLGLLISALLGVPAGAALGLSRTSPRGLISTLIYTGMGLPPVVVGLFVFLLLSRSGPLGALGWLFTLRAMVAAQVVISFPVVLGLTMAAVQSVDPELRLQVRALGATRWQTGLAVLSEARLGVIGAIVAGFGSIISEVGAVMMVGGNIAGRTRVLTTAIVLETGKGDFALAMALGLILLGLTFTTSWLLLRMRGRP